MDKLKPLSEVTQEDGRGMMPPLEEWHGLLNDLRLNDSVPDDVRQLFENAKNVGLYSIFAFRLHQPAELVAIGALERALLEKYRQEYPESKKKLLFIELENEACRSGWLDSIDVSGYRNLARENLITKAMEESIDADSAEQAGMEIPAPTPGQVEKEFQRLDLPRFMISKYRKVRNMLAHGSAFLYPTCYDALLEISIVINALFPNQQDNECQASGDQARQAPEFVEFMTLPELARRAGMPLDRLLAGMRDAELLVRPEGEAKWVPGLSAEGLHHHPRWSIRVLDILDARDRAFLERQQADREKWVVYSNVDMAAAAVYPVASPDGSKWLCVECGKFKRKKLFASHQGRKLCESCRANHTAD